jgi:D-3-phosphoglycerate dehydrogenase
VEAQCRNENELIEVARNADAILNQYAPISARVIANLAKCRVISRFGVGVDGVDLSAATRKGIYVANVPDYCQDEVSDHALALLLACARKVVLLNSQVKQGYWDYKQGRPIFRLRGQTLGLLAFGRIPRALCQKALALGLKVIVYDPFISAAYIQEAGAEPAKLAEVLRQADFLSVHMPLNEDTRGIVNRQALQQMKETAFVINTSRGPIVDETDLIEALQNGWIAGAGLDVLESEGKLASDHPLVKMDNVIMTPHVAWYSEESEEELRRKVAHNVLQVLKGFPPDYYVNREVRPWFAVDRLGQ